jgi:hypothetical protein
MIADEDTVGERIGYLFRIYFILFFFFFAVV